MAGCLVRQGTHRWPDRLGEMSDRLGIQAVGLGQSAHRPGEAAGWRGLTTATGRPAAARVAVRRNLHVADGLKHDERWLKRDQELDQRHYLLLAIIDREARAGRAQVHIEPVLGDIDANEPGSLVHDPVSLDMGLLATSPSGPTALLLKTAPSRTDCVPVPARVLVLHAGTGTELFMPRLFTRMLHGCLLRAVRFWP